MSYIDMLIRTLAETRLRDALLATVLLVIFHYGLLHPIAAVEPGLFKTALVTVYGAISLTCIIVVLSFFIKSVVNLFRKY